MPMTVEPPEEDPTALTQKAVERAANASRDYVDGQVGILKERLRGIDTATELLSATVNRVPTDLQTAIRDILRLMDERDLRVQARFDANEKLSKTESELNQTALAAALQSAKEAAQVQVDTFSSLIRGLGERIDRTIDKNAELAQVASNALSARVTEVNHQTNRLEQRVGSIEAGKTAVAEQRTDIRGGSANIYGLVGAIVGVMSLVIAAVAVIIATR